MNSRTRRLIAGLLLVGLVLVMGLLLAIRGVLRPAPATASRAPGPTTVTTRTDAEAAPEAPVEATEACPVRVRVQDEAGAPVPEAKVQLLVRAGIRPDFLARGSGPDPRTGPDGLVEVEANCGEGRLIVRAEGLAPHRREGIDTLVQRELRVVLKLGVRVEGVIFDEKDGSPIEGARVSSGATSTTSEASGAYLLRVDPAEVRAIEASAPGYATGRERLRLSGPAEAVTLDLALSPTREVQVWCLGQPEDRCDAILPIYCTHPLLPLGELCALSEGQTRCPCPEGEAAVRGGGAAVLIEDGATEAILDLRFDGGGLRGRALSAGGPARCQLRAVRMPVGLEDIPLGLAASQATISDANGVFAFQSLKPGNYQLQAECGDAGIRMIHVGEIGAEVVDLGDIHLDAGGSIEGVVLDGVTGEGAVGEPVVAVLANSAVGAGGTAISGTEGRFRLSGLEEGEYEVLLAKRPLSSQRITVRSGEPVGGVELETGEAALLETNKVQLATDDEGGLVVAGNGGDLPLSEGDRVLSVEIGGVDLRDVIPGLSDDLMDAVLDHYSGPGVSLVVEGGTGEGADDGAGERTVPLR